MVAQVQCSKCGTLIPALGVVCPFCGADKTGDVAKLKAENAQGKAALAGCGIVIAGFVLGSTVGHGFDYLIGSKSTIVSFIGAGVGAVLGVVLCSRIAWIWDAVTKPRK